jgi:hypothetical protein
MRCVRQGRGVVSDQCVFVSQSVSAFLLCFRRAALVDVGVRVQKEVSPGVVVLSSKLKVGWHVGFQKDGHVVEGKDDGEGPRAQFRVEPHAARHAPTLVRCDSL